MLEIREGNTIFSGSFATKNPSWEFFSAFELARSVVGIGSLWALMLPPTAALAGKPATDFGW